jgi:hypothetical protein
MRTLFFAIAMLAAVSASAQKVHHAFTLLVGPSLDWYKPSTPAIINGGPSNKAINGTGYQIALRYDYLKATYIGFGAQIAFDHTSAGIFRNYDINGLPGAFKDSLFVHTFAMNTIDLPVFIKLRLFNGRYNTSYTYFNAGPGVQMLMGSKRKVSVYNTGYKSQYPDLTDNPSFTSTITPYFMAAMGRLMMTRKYVFTLELEYNAGIGSYSYKRFSAEVQNNPAESFRRNSLILNLGIRLQNYKLPGCHEF